MSLRSCRYGKARVRVLRLGREEARHTVRELTVQVLLEGDLARAWTEGDNRSIVATDTIKNIVNVQAHDHLDAENEVFAQAVAGLFLERYPHLSSVEVSATETRWRRLVVDGAPHDHGFTLDGNGRPTVRVTATREGARTESGVAGFTFMKTTMSGWSDFHDDEYRTLADTTDRILATSMDAVWTWTGAPGSYEAANARVIEVMLGVFVDGYSRGAQDSMYRMGEAALAALPEIGEIRMVMPNKHYIPINLAPFDRENKGNVFLPTDEPHGQIEAVIGRG